MEKKIDFENHYYTKATLDYFTGRTSAPTYDPESTVFYPVGAMGVPLKTLQYDITDMGEKRVEILREHGISQAVLSCSPSVEMVEGEDSVMLARSCNDEVYEATRKFPDAFLGSACLPVTMIDAAVKELIRCKKELNFVLWHTHSNYGANKYVSDPEYLPLLACAAELKMPVYVHPNIPQDPRYTRWGISFAGPGLGFTVDTLTTVLTLIVSGVFDEFPDLQVIVGHLGETFPFLMDRMDNRFSAFAHGPLKNDHEISYYFAHKNVMVTTSGNMSKEAFFCTKNVLGIESILFGSDYPYENMADMRSFLDSLPLTVAERAAVDHTNAEKYVLNR